VRIGAGPSPAIGFAVEPGCVRAAGRRAVSCRLAVADRVCASCAASHREHRGRGRTVCEEARRIHYKEVPERGIRGVATRAEAQALEDEGVRIMALPFPELETLQ